MVFADLIFLYCFLPLNLIFYYMSGNKLWRNIVLVAFSLFFYAWGEPVWIILLIFSATIDYFHGLMVEANRGNVKAKLAVASSVVVNLGLLGIFKYSGLLYETINSVFGLSLKVPTFALPIGISFYTFQTISYVIDVYRGEAAAQRSYLKFLMYVSLYPQLVAGPIVRYRDVETEINVRTETLAGISRGMSRFCVGLLKKTLIANFAGSLSAGFLGGDLNNLSVLGAWYGIALYAIQIYYDFSGYSDMAIGLANMFGFHYLENFNYPYVSRSATEFWRRWHISLGTFFREYLYIPLGGNRNMMIRNLLVTWFLTGLWHGASWNFVVWGLFWGMLILIEKLFLSRVLECVPRIFSHLYLLAAMLVGWVFFYFVDLGTGLAYIGRMFGIGAPALWDLPLMINISNNLFWFLAAVLFCAPAAPRIAQALSKKKALVSAVVPAVSIFCLLVSTALLVGQSYNPFLYFRF